MQYFLHSSKELNAIVTLCWQFDPDHGEIIGVNRNDSDAVLQDRVFIAQSKPYFDREMYRARFTKIIARESDNHIECAAIASVYEATFPTITIELDGQKLKVGLQVYDRDKTSKGYYCQVVFPDGTVQKIFASFPRAEEEIRRCREGSRFIPLCADNERIFLYRMNPKDQNGLFKALIKAEILSQSQGKGYGPNPIVELLQPLEPMPNWNAVVHAISQQGLIE